MVAPPTRALVLLAPVLALTLALALALPGGRDAAYAQAPVTSDSTVIGQSVRGRPIEVGCAGPAAAEASATVLLVAGIHTGGEAITTTLALEFAEATWRGEFSLPDGTRLCVLPVLNPDGIAEDLHTNARGVDLNRNWPADDWQQDAYHPETGPVSGGSAPLSEPETRALFEYVRTTQPSAVVVLHCCGSLVEANSQPLAVDLAHAYGEAAGFDYLPRWDFYEITGELIDAMDRLGVPAFDIEMARPDDTGLESHLRGMGGVLEHLAGRATRADTLAGGAVASQPTAAARPAISHLYQVRHGDTMWRLAARFGVATNALAAANNITHPSHFMPGRVLAVPVPPAMPAR